jgi:hypothetical protein
MGCTIWRCVWLPRPREGGESSRAENDGGSSAEGGAALKKVVAVVWDVQEADDRTLELVSSMPTGLASNRLQTYRNCMTT